MMSSHADGAAYEHNGHPVSRSDFYAIACNPARSVAVEACAGAGKTWMLVSRILRALLDGTPPHEILAITFTKKAAGEMRQRLQEWLAQCARSSPQELEQELIVRGIAPQDARDKREQLQNLYQNMLCSGRTVQIRTFHSWFAALLSSAPLAFLQERGLPTSYELLEDDTAAIAQVWPEFLHCVAQDARLRADYVALIAEHGRAQTEKALEQALKKRVEFTLADEAGIVQASVPPFGVLYPSLAQFEFPAQALDTDAARQRWLERAQQLGKERKTTPQNAAQQVIQAWQQPDVHQRLQMLRAAFFVASADRLNKNLEKFAPAQEAEVELQLLCAARAQHEGWHHQQRMMRLSRCLIECFGQLKRTRGWIDMNDIERTALGLLSDPVLAGWVQERLDMRVRHLLIDEFQDTNPLQWHALYAWLSGYAGAGAGQLQVFIVGDPKQSIYRFRRAEPQVFEAAQLFIRDGLGGDILACDHTRRNAQSIVRCVNTVMHEVQNQGLYKGFRTHSAQSHDEGALLHLPPIVPNTDCAADTADTADTADAVHWRDSLSQARHEAEQTLHMHECAQAARWIEAQCAAGLKPQEVMVLSRKRERLARMQEALGALHIACVQPEKTDLAQAPEVQDLIALLDVLVSPGHDVSLARALKSPLFGCPDTLLSALALLRRQTAYADVSWFELLQKEELLALIPQGLEADFVRNVAARLIQYRTWVAQLPPHDALQAIYQHGDVLARFAASAPATRRTSVLAHLRALLGAALQQNQGRYLTPYAFIRALKKAGVPAPSAPDVHAVQLLTIHGAKGLEAHSVLLLDTDAPPQRAESMGVLVDWPGAQPVPRGFIFLARETSPPPSAHNTLEVERTERQREELNTLYVAMTRAKQRLVLSAVQSTRSNPDSWYKRLVALCAAADHIAPEPISTPSKQQRLNNLDSFACTLLELPAMRARTTLPLPNGEGEGEGSTDGEDDDLPARQGKAMHALLEQTDTTVAALEHARTHGWSEARLAQLARQFALPQSGIHSAAIMAQAILNGEGAWVWDATQLECAFNEAPITYQGHSLRLDRLVRLRQARAGAHWWVLDYKSAAQPLQHTQLIEQLQRYRHAVAHCTAEAVQAAFLTGEGKLVMLPT